MKQKKLTQVQKLRETIQCMAEVHKRRFQDYKEKEQAWESTLTTQAGLHAREVTALVVRCELYRESLCTSLVLIKAMRNAEWTPADDQLLAQIQKVAGME